MAQHRKAEVVPELERATASDVKKLGWRGMMKTVRRAGKLLVTNHNEPEAVILSLDEYDMLLRRAMPSSADSDAVLDMLRRRFDERLSALQADDAGRRLRQVIREPVRLRGKVKAGAGH